MRSELFFIPHELLGIPVFGLGWGVILVAIGYVGFVGWIASRTKHAKSAEKPAKKSGEAPPNWQAEAWAVAPMFLIAAALCYFVFPNVESRWPDGTPIGLPIRGYGVMVLLGLLLGIGLTIVRGRQLGLSSDSIIGLGFWMMVLGLVGARTFYVIQNWSDFDSLGAIFQLTEGGLVIYGGVIGGLVGAITYCWRHQLKILAVADLVAPGFLMGQAVGRIGCLLHGCCFGGVCTAELPAIYFPHGSIPYQSQLANGRLLGLQLDPPSRFPSKVTLVEQDSVAEELGIQEGQTVDFIEFAPVPPESNQGDPTKPLEIYSEISVDGERYTFLPPQLPSTSRATHPSQIYSAINAFLLCALVWLLQPLPRRDGMVFCVAVILYTTARFLLEGIRSDEAAQFGTGLSIAQNFSVLAILVCVVGLVIIQRKPAGRAWRWGLEQPQS